MAAASPIKIEGLEGLVKSFNLLPGETNKVIRRTMSAAIATVRTAAREAAPKAEKSFTRHFRSTGTRVEIKPGTLRKAIKSKAKQARGNRNRFEGVLTVDEGSQDSRDAFYWRFVEFGTKDQPARPFIRPAAQDAENKIEGIVSNAMEQSIANVIKGRKA